MNIKPETTNIAISKNVHALLVSHIQDIDGKIGKFVEKAIVDKVNREKLPNKLSDITPYVDRLHPFSKSGLRFYDVFHKILKGEAMKEEVEFAESFAKEYINKL